MSLYTLQSILNLQNGPIHLVLKKKFFKYCWPKLVCLLAFPFYCFTVALEIPLSPPCWFKSKIPLMVSPPKFASCGYAYPTLCAILYSPFPCLLLQNSVLGSIDALLLLPHRMAVGWYEGGEIDTFLQCLQFIRVACRGWHKKRN